MKLLLFLVVILSIFVPDVVLAVEPDTADVTVYATPGVVVAISLLILAGGIGVLRYFGYLGGKREDGDNW